ncbi:MAG: hypothetical protein JKY03_12495 [Aureispira sp.]|nr:hypothetical protein [Aureispira sp.]
MEKKITRTTNYQLNVEIKENAANVFNFYCDLQNHVHLHPLLTKVTIVETFQKEKGQEVTVYEIQERITVLGFISVSNTYTVHRILLREEKKCVFEVKSFPNISLSSAYLFSERGVNCTQLEEKVKIEAPWGLSGFVTKTAKNAHYISLTKLKQHFAQKNEQLV